MSSPPVRAERILARRTAVRPAAGRPGCARLFRADPDHYSVPRSSPHSRGADAGPRRPPLPLIASASRRADPRDRRRGRRARSGPAGAGTGARHRRRAPELRGRAPAGAPDRRLHRRDRARRRIERDPCDRICQPGGRARAPGARSRTPSPTSAARSRSSRPTTRRCSIARRRCRRRTTTLARSPITAVSSTSSMTREWCGDTTGVIASSRAARIWLPDRRSRPSTRTGPTTTTGTSPTCPVPGFMPGSGTWSGRRATSPVRRGARPPMRGSTAPRARMFLRQGLLQLAYASFEAALRADGRDEAARRGAGEALDRIAATAASANDDGMPGWPAYVRAGSDGAGRTGVVALGALIAGSGLQSVSAVLELPEAGGSAVLRVATFYAGARRNYLRARDGAGGALPIRESRTVVQLEAEDGCGRPDCPFLSTFRLPIDAAGLRTDRNQRITIVDDGDRVFVVVIRERPSRAAGRRPGAAARPLTSARPPSSRRRSGARRARRGSRPRAASRAVRPGVVEAARRLDQHVEAHQQAERVPAALVVDHRVVDDQRAARRAAPRAPWRAAPLLAPGPSRAGCAPSPARRPSGSGSAKKLPGWKRRRSASRAGDIALRRPARPAAGRSRRRSGAGGRGRPVPAARPARSRRRRRSGSRPRGTLAAIAARGGRLTPVMPQEPLEPGRVGIERREGSPSVPASFCGRPVRNASVSRPQKR